MVRSKGATFPLGPFLTAAAAGIHPSRAVPVVLDVGTDNLDLLNDETYLGYRHARVRGERYDEFVDRFVQTVTRLYPNAMIHWEDFGADNAHKILQRYRDEICTFNDDIQGTAAVVVAAILSAVRRSGLPLSQQRIVVHGDGTAGVGIAAIVDCRASFIATAPYPPSAGPFLVRTAGCSLRAAGARPKGREAGR